LIGTKRVARLTKRLPSTKADLRIGDNSPLLMVASIEVVFATGWLKAVDGSMNSTSIIPNKSVRHMPHMIKFDMVSYRMPSIVCTQMRNVKACLRRQHSLPKQEFGSCGPVSARCCKNRVQWHQRKSSCVPAVDRDVRHQRGRRPQLREEALRKSVVLTPTARGVSRLRRVPFGCLNCKIY
jgi:hypothetical protein